MNIVIIPAISSDIKWKHLVDGLKMAGMAPTGESLMEFFLSIPGAKHHCFFSFFTVIPDPIALELSTISYPLRLLILECKVETGWKCAMISGSFEEFKNVMTDLLPSSSHTIRRIFNLIYTHFEALGFGNQFLFTHSKFQTQDGAWTWKRLKSG